MQNLQITTVERYSVRQRLMSASLTLAMTGSATATAALANGSPAFQPQAMTGAQSATQSFAAMHAAHAALNHSGGASGASPFAALVHTAAASAVNGTAAAGAAGTAGVSGFAAAAHMHHITNTFNSATLSQSLHNSKNIATALATQAGGKNDVNLASSNPIFQAGGLAGFHQITLDIGGKQQLIGFDTQLTGAELVAAQQVLSGASQSLVINSHGVATGGTFNLSNTTLQAIDTAIGGSLGSLVVSRGVQAVDSLSQLNLTGTLINLGTIAVGAAAGVTGQTMDTISASNIFNSHSGTIASSTILNVLTPTSITLNASDTFANNGVIRSSGSLNISAPNFSNDYFGNITHSAANAPTLSAAGNVNLVSQNLTNGGLISSTTGNVNISNGGGNNNIVLNGAGGTVQALSGNINFNDASNTGNGNITVTGGNYLSQQINLNAGVGAINANIGEVTGQINGAAGESHVSSATDNMVLGNICVSGDPTYFNTAGDITINGALTGSPDLAVIASGNIIGTSNGSLDTSSAVNGGTILLAAGAGFSTTPTGASGTGSNAPGSGGDSTTKITFTNGPSTTGGYIDLSGNFFKENTGPIQKIDASGGTGHGGDVTMVAYKGTAQNSGLIVATEDPLQSFNNVPGTDTIKSTGATGGGTVTLIGNGSAIFLQNIDAGAVNIYGATPTITGTLNVTNGTISGGGSFGPGASSATQILATGTLTASGTSAGTAASGVVNASTGSTFEVGNTAAKGALTVNATSTIFVDGIAQAASVNLKSTASDLEVASIITAGAGGVVGVNNGNGSNGGNITLEGTGVFVNYLDSSGGGGAGGGTAGQAGGAGGNAGNITLIAHSDNIQIFPITPQGGSTAPGQINASGGGGGGGAGGLAAAGGAGGAGGNAGTVTITTPFSFIGAVETVDSTGTLQPNQSIVAYNGGAGGQGGTGIAAGPGGGGGAGGGSYGGGGGGGAAAASGTGAAAGGGGGGGTAGGGGGAGSNTANTTSGTGGGGGSSLGTLGISTPGAGGTGNVAGQPGLTNQGTTGQNNGGTGGNGGVPSGVQGGTGSGFSFGGVGGGTSSVADPDPGAGANGFAPTTINGTGTVLLTVGDKVGTAAIPVVIDAANLTLTAAGKTANVYLASFADSLTIKNATLGANTTFSESALGSLTIDAAGAISGGGTVLLNGQLGVAVNGNITATKSISVSTLVIDGESTSGGITGAGVLQAPTVTLATDLSGAGNITATVKADTVSANAGGSTILLTAQSGSTKGATSLLASSVADGGTITVNAAQQLNVTGVLTNPNGTININETGATGGINFTAAPNLGLLTTSALNLSTTGSGSILSSKAITAANITINAAGPVGASTSKAFLTNTLTALTVNETTSSNVFIKDSNTSVAGFTLTGAGQLGANINIATAAQKVNVGNLSYANVTIANTSTAATSTVNFTSGSLNTLQIGNGTGVVSVTTNAATINEDSTALTPGLDGTSVVLKSTAGTVGGTASLVITAPSLSASAAKGNVNVTDRVAVTLAAGSAKSNYVIDAPGITVGGVIGGSTISLNSSGALAINANVGAASTGVVTLTADGVITQTAKAVTSGLTIAVVENAANSFVGSETQSLTIKAGTAMTFNGASGDSFYVNQNGKATLGASASSGGALLLTDATALTINNHVTFQNVTITAPSLNFANSSGPGPVTPGQIAATDVIITAPVVTIGGSSFINASSSATFLSSGALAISGTGAVNVASGGNLTLGGTVGTKTTSTITLGDKGTGANNPLLANLTNTLSNLTVTATGAFTTALSGNTISTKGSGGTINIKAASLVDVGNTNNPIVLQDGAVGAMSFGKVFLNLTQAITLDGTASTGKNPAPFEIISQAGGTNTVSVTSGGALVVNAGGLGTATGTSLTLSGAKSLGVNVNIFDNNQYSSVTLGSGSTTPFVVAAGGTSVSNGVVGSIKTGLVAIDSAGTITTSGAGQIIASNGFFSNTKGVLTMLGSSSTDIQISANLGLSAKSGITLGDKTGAGDPLSNSLVNSTLSSITVATGGNFTSDISTFATKHTATGTIDFVAGNIVVLGSNAADPVTFDVGANAGSVAGSLILALTGTQAVVLNNATPLKGQTNLVIKDAGIANTGSVLVSAGGTLSLIDPSGLQVGTSLSSLNLSGGKGLAVTAANLLPTVTTLNLNSGAGSALQIGAASALAGGNAIVGNLSAVNIFVSAASGINILSGTTVASNQAGGSVEFDTKNLINNGTVSSTSNGHLLINITNPSASFVESGAGAFTNFASFSGAATGNFDGSTLFSKLTALNDFTASVGGALTFQATGTPGITVGSGGAINIDAGTLASKSTTTPITFNAPGASSIDIVSKAALAVGAAKGNIEFAAGTGNAAGSSVELTSAGNLTFTESKTFNDAFLDGSSVILTGASSVNSPTLMVISTNKSGAITTGTGSFVSNNLTLAETNVKLAKVATNITDTGTLTLGANLGGTKYAGALNVNNLAPTGTATIFEAVPVAAFTYNGANSATLNSISTTNGGIIVSVSSGALNVANNATLSTNAGSILLQNTNTTNGTISVGTGVTMHGSGTAAGVGQVSIVIGALPTSKQLAPGTPPTNAPTVLKSGGATVTFGSTLTPGDATDTIIINGTGANTILNAEGRNVVFSGGKATGTTITLQGNDTIIADPPVGASTATAVSTSLVSAAVYTPAASTAAINPVSVAATSTRSSGEISTAGLSNLAAFNAASAIIAAPTITGANSIDSENQTASAAPVVSVGQGNKLSGGVTNVAERRMDRGVLLLSPEANTRVKCGDATVDVAANSVALLVAFEGGVAVYNLHDTNRGAVAVAQGDHRLAIQPGRSVVITNRRVEYFEDVNPAEFVGYRRVAARAYEDGVRTFQSEYNLFSLMQGLPPLKTMVASKDARDKKAVASMMKTAAILLSTNDATPFERMPARRMTAMATSAGR